MGFSLYDCVCVGVWVCVCTLVKDERVHLCCAMLWIYDLTMAE